MKPDVGTCAGYTRSPAKHGAGPDVVVLGLWASVASPDGPSHVITSNAAALNKVKEAAVCPSERGYGCR